MWLRLVPITLLLLAAAGCVDDGGLDPEGTNNLTSHMDTDLAPRTTSPASTTATWRSTLYPSNWTPGYTTSDGHRIHDFSYAGYHNGEGEPTWPGLVYDVVTKYGADKSGASDATAAVQNAINAAQTAGGGVVYFPAGTYRIDGKLAVTKSGVVLQGAGSDTTKMYFTLTSGMNYLSHITFRGSLSYSGEVLLAKDGASFQNYVEVGDVTPYKVGDDVVIGWVITPEFIEEHKMTGIWVSFNDTWQPFFWREITRIDSSVNPPRLYVDVPLRYPSKKRDSASIKKVSGYLSEVGMVGLSVSNVTDWEGAWSISQVHVLEFSAIKDGWIEDVRSYASPLSPTSGHGAGDHLQSGGILTEFSKRVTITDSDMSHAENRGGGGNGYLFEIRQSNEILTRDSAAVDGRHNFIQNWGFGTTGCVWLRVYSAGGRAFTYSWQYLGKPSYSEFHHSLATANLIDSSTFDDGWQIENRLNWSSGAGHTGTETVMWNTAGDGMLKSLQWGYGYVVGTQPSVNVETNFMDPNSIYTSPQDWSEGVGEASTLSPQSLYTDQLAKRLAL